MNILRQFILNARSINLIAAFKWCQKKIKVNLMNRFNRYIVFKVNNLCGMGDGF